MENEKIEFKYETLWKLIIRPPRDDYDEELLGDKVFTYQDKTYTRKDYNLVSSQGNILKCSFIEPEEKYRPTEIMPVVVYLHGNSSSRLEGMRMAGYLLKRGINLFVFDFAGSGLSEGEYITLGYREAEDLDVIIQFIEKLPGVGKIGLWGRSMGAATTMLYAHRNKNISAIVMDSPFADFYRLAKEQCLKMIKLPNFVLSTVFSIVKRTVRKKTGLDISQLRPIDYAERTNTPSIFIHALNDELIDIAHSIELNQKYNGPKSLISCKGGHNSNRPRALLEKVGRFFSLYLKGIDENEISKHPIKQHRQFSHNEIVDDYSDDSEDDEDEH